MSDSQLKATVDTAGSVLELITKTHAAILVLPGLIAGVIALALTLPPWAYWLAAGASIVLIIGALVVIIWRRRYMPLAAAAVKTYEALEGTVYAKAAERMPDVKTAETLTEYMSHLLANHVSIYARHPPSRKLRRVPDRRIKRGVFENGGKVLGSTDGRDHDLIDVSVKRSELRKAISVMKAEGKSFDAIVSVKEGLNLNWMQTLKATINSDD